MRRGARLGAPSLLQSSATTRRRQVAKRNLRGHEEGRTVQLVGVGQLGDHVVRLGERCRVEVAAVALVVEAVDRRPAGDGSR